MVLSLQEVVARLFFGCSEDVIAAWLPKNIKTFRLLLSSTIGCRAMRRPYNSPEYAVNC